MASQEAEPGDAGKAKAPPACHTEPVRNTLFFSKLVKFEIICN